jgi:hypothetical protein
MLKQINAFRDKIRNLERWQKIALVLIAVAIPAGIMLSSILILKLKSGKNQRR